MAIEIERKFLLTNDEWRSQVKSRSKFVQGYLSTTPERTVRIRMADEQAWLTVKGKSCGNSRCEYEYTIPLTDAVEMLDCLCKQPLIEKWRYRLDFCGHQWEIDEFIGSNNGLLVAEIELKEADEKFSRPTWLGDEVSDDPRYFNSNLCAHPFSCWNNNCSISPGEKNPVP
ncbi:MAG: adenylate cyclase [Desulfobacteraceae bacterium 4572_35.1]|nr:MAG: adenylate cyclase [Desulfobacteraceae bacterium 4572_35.1]